MTLLYAVFGLIRIVVPVVLAPKIRASTDQMRSVAAASTPHTHHPVTTRPMTGGLFADTSV
jgi:hypothetical protein